MRYGRPVIKGGEGWGEFKEEGVVGVGVQVGREGVGVIGGIEREREREKGKRGIGEIYIQRGGTKRGRRNRGKRNRGKRNSWSRKRQIKEKEIAREERESQEGDDEEKHRNRGRG